MILARKGFLEFQILGFWAFLSLYPTVRRRGEIFDLSLSIPHVCQAKEALAQLIHVKLVHAFCTR